MLLDWQTGIIDSLFKNEDSRPGNTFMNPPWKSWTKWPGRWKSPLLGLGYGPHDQSLDKRNDHGTKLHPNAADKQ